MSMTPPVLFLYGLRAIQRTAHLPDSLFLAPNNTTGYTQTHHLEVKPGIWLADVLQHLPGLNWISSSRPLEILMVS